MQGFDDAKPGHPFVSDSVAQQYPSGRVHQMDLTDATARSRPIMDMGADRDRGPPAAAATAMAGAWSAAGFRVSATANSSCITVAATRVIR